MTVSDVGIHLFSRGISIYIYIYIWGQFGGFAYFKIMLPMEQLYPSN